MTKLIKAIDTFFDASIDLSYVRIVEAAKIFGNKAINDYWKCSYAKYNW